MSGRVSSDGGWVGVVVGVPQLLYHALVLLDVHSGARSLLMLLILPAVR